MPSTPDRQGVTALLYKEQAPHRWKRHLNLSPSQFTLLGFALVILVGSGLLWLPLSVSDEHVPSYLTALFTATSAVCVTGLRVVDTATYFTPFGQVVILLLIQIGGLGYMTMYSLMLLAVGRRLSLRDRLALQEVLDLSGPGGVLRFLLQIVLTTMLIELVGLCFLAATWVPEYGWGRGLYLALFQSVAAFNNAGFTLFPDSLVTYRASPGVVFTVAALVITGGLGYPVINELRLKLLQPERRLMWRHFTLNTRVGLISTGWLLLVGTLMILLFEGGNPNTLGGLPWWDQLMSAFFAAVMPRTGGFSTINTASMTNAALFFTLMLMFIGTNPGGTGGGVKTTTLAVLLAQAMAVIRGQQSITLQQRRLNVNTLRKAATTMIISWGVINAVAMILAMTEQKDFLRLMFEAVSAFGTVGLSAGITPTLSPLGQLIIIATMYAGRVGVITIGMAIWAQQSRSAVQYAEESLLVG